MTKEVLTLTLKFMERVTLNGSEVPAFNVVVSALNAELEKSDTKTRTKQG